MREVLYERVFDGINSPGERFCGSNFLQGGAISVRKLFHGEAIFVMILKIIRHYSFFQKKKCAKNNVSPRIVRKNFHMCNFKLEWNFLGEFP